MPKEALSFSNSAKNFRDPRLRSARRENAVRGRKIRRHRPHAAIRRIGNFSSTPPYHPTLAGPRGEGLSMLSPHDAIHDCLPVPVMGWYTGRLE